MPAPLFVHDLAALRRKLAAPPPLLAKVYPRFQERLRQDGEFRRHHIFLPALLGDSAAIAEAKGELFTLALNPLILAHQQSPGSQTTAQDSLDGHVWCVAPRAMRLAVYTTWLAAHHALTPAEHRQLGTALLDFFAHYVVPVLRARTPGGHNQQLSMTFCSAVTGHAFADVEGVAARAGALRDWALPKLTQTLGLMPASGYSGEGAAYQSGVVSALSMWASVFLEQLGEREVWQRRWAPNDSTLAATLQLEAALGSCGGLLPPWDNYGWAPIGNLAARTLWARLSGRHELLGVADRAWDEANFIAWRPDDRLWTLLYWPDREAAPASAAPGAASPLTGWSLPAVGAAAEHLGRRLRVMLAWDACSEGVQGIGRAQVNPNHLTLDLAGEPVTADGWEDGSVRLFTAAAYERTRQTLPAVEQEMIARQYGSVERWLAGAQQGLLGAACAIVVDGWETYFPRPAREGRLLYEERRADRHTFAGEAAAYYQPAFDVTRMRRTVALGANGVIWLVDDVQAATPHEFTWRVWLRRGARALGPQRVGVEVPGGHALTFAWLADGPVTVTTVPSFPQTHGWPDAGSERCDLVASGRAARFVTCIVPEAAEGLAVRASGTDAWEATWAGGSDRFALPAAVHDAPDAPPVTGVQLTGQQTSCDLDEAPFALLDEPDAALLAALDQPPRPAWRRTGAAMQTLTVRGNRAALPKIVALLQDAGQNYTVHSVAAWCLGHARYAPALPVLQRLANIPEVNTALRARWAAARLAAAGAS